MLLGEPVFSKALRTSSCFEPLLPQSRTEKRDKNEATDYRGRVRDNHKGAFE